MNDKKIGFIAAIGALFVIFLAIALSTVPALIAAGLLCWVTGFSFWPVFIFVYVLMMIFGRGR